MSRSPERAHPPHVPRAKTPPELPTGDPPPPIAPLVEGDISYIGNRIYVGSIEAARKNFLRDNGFTHVLSIGKKPYEHEPYGPLQGFTWKYMDAEDGPTEGIKNIFEAAFQFIDEGTKERHGKKNRILVHCGQGYSRAPAVVMAYLHYRKRFTWRQAFMWVAKRRPQIDITDEFKEYMARKSGADTKAEDFDLPGDSLDHFGRVAARLEYFEKSEISFKGCQLDHKEEHQLVFPKE